MQSVSLLMGGRADGRMGGQTEQTGLRNDGPTDHRITGQRDAWIDSWTHRCMGGLRVGAWAIAWAGRQAGERKGGRTG